MLRFCQFIFSSFKTEQLLAAESTLASERKDNESRLKSAQKSSDEKSREVEKLMKRTDELQSLIKEEIAKSGKLLVSVLLNFLFLLHL
jgi:predicted transcriptional regulator